MIYLWFEQIQNKLNISFFFFFPSYTHLYSISIFTNDFYILNTIFFVATSESWPYIYYDIYYSILMSNIDKKYYQDINICIKQIYLDIIRNCFFFFQERNNINWEMDNTTLLIDVCFFFIIIKIYFQIVNFFTRKACSETSNSVRESPCQHPNFLWKQKIIKI